MKHTSDSPLRELFRPLLFIVWGLLLAQPIIGKATTRPDRTAVASAAAAEATVRRFALVVGANNGGPERPALRYATSDARAMAAVLEELGGVMAADRVLLLEPDRTTLDAALATLGRRIAVEKKGAGRTEVLLYYSGHSDEEGLLLGGHRYEYLALRRALDKLPADVRIAILDSCSSGALLRAKGGKRRPSFLVDASSSVKGHAFLTSSSEDEAAQESERLKGSFFTWSLISGLRGAADVTRDRRVTLNEAYQFAFQETLSRTERTASGPQHPTYDIRLVGTGDLVLTDLRGSGAGIILAEDLAGRLFVRDTQGRLVAELFKPAGQAVDLGFEPGTYVVTLKSSAGTLESRIVVEAGTRLELGVTRFAPVAVERTARRGDAAEGESPAPVAEGLESSSPVALTPYEGAGEEGAALEAWTTRPATPVNTAPLQVLSGVVSLVPPLSTNPVVTENQVTHNSVGVVGSRNNRVRGWSASTAFDWIDRDLSGLQASGALNVAGGRVYGVQLSGGANVAGAVDRGVQAAGALNVSGQSMRGLQATGGGNLVVGSLKGVQLAGALNVTSGDHQGWQASGVLNIANNVVGLQSAGVANFAAGEVYGLQFSGVFNIAAGSVGSQIGVINIARGEVRGLQLGLINIAEESAVPIGLVSFVRNGYHNLNVWGDELSAAHVGIKTGGSVVYNNFAIGWQPWEDRERLLVSLGIGVHLGGPRLFVDLEALATNFLEPGIWESDNVLGTLRAGVGFQLFRHLAVIAGPTVNVFTTSAENDLDLGIDGEVLYSDNSTIVRMWPGVFGGVQF